MRANELMEQLAHRYATCSGYLDFGSVVRWNCANDKPDKPDVVFKTFFIRSSKFGFKWGSEYGLSKIWFDGSETFSFYDFKSAPKSEPSLQEALIPASGVTMGAAFEVPALLMPELLKQPSHNTSLLSMVNDFRTKESEYIGSEDCHCITGSALDNEIDVVLWIAKRDFSLKQIRETVSIPVEDETNISRKLNSRPSSSNYAENSIQSEVWSTTIIYEDVAFGGGVDLQIFERDF